jgi:hypothetical protein
MSAAMRPDSGSIPAWRDRFLSPFRSCRAFRGSGPVTATQGQQPAAGRVQRVLEARVDIRIFQELIVGEAEGLLQDQ